jgi:acetyl esterase/lipase
MILKLNSMQRLMQRWSWIAGIVSTITFTLCPSLVLGQQGVLVVPDIKYVENDDDSAVSLGNRRNLDLYLPADLKCFPTLMSVFGGGLRKGEKSQDASKGKLFAKSGIATAVINYRLSPEVSHPLHVKDVANAFAWVKRNISKYGGDSDAIYVIGHSAGAYLITLLALDGSFLASDGLKLNAIKGAIPVSAFHDVDQVAPNRPKDVWGSNPKFWKSASTTPQFFGRTSNPEMPWLIIIADGDDKWRKDQNYSFIKNLKRVGFVNVNLIEIKGRDHNSIWEGISDGDMVSNQVIAFVSKNEADKDRNSCKIVGDL